MEWGAPVHERFCYECALRDAAEVCAEQQYEEEFNELSQGVFFYDLSKVDRQPLVDAAYCELRDELPWSGVPARAFMTVADAKSDAVVSGYLAESSAAECRLQSGDMEMIDAAAAETGPWVTEAGQCQPVLKQMLDRMLDCDASLRAVAASKKGCPPPHTGNCVAIVPKTSYARIDELQNKGKYCHTLGEATTLGVGQLQALVVTTLERASIEPSFVASYDASLDGAKTLAEMRQNRFKAGECTAISHSLRFPGLC